MVKKLTKEAETRLMQALNQIADLTNDGKQPNEAIAKVASELQVPHGHVQLLVNAYNTGRTTAQRRSTDDVWSKAAEFPMADTGKILELMYPDNVKSAATIINETSIADEYNCSPGWVLRKQLAEIKKADNIDWKMVDPPIPYPKEDHSYTEARMQIKKAEHEIRESRYRAAYVFDMAIKLKDEIKDHLKMAGAPDINSVYRNSISIHGDVAKQLFDHLIKEDSHLIKTSKAASTKIKQASGKIYDLIADCVEACNAYYELRTDFENKEAEFVSLKEELLRPFSQPANNPVIGSPESVLGKGQKAGLQSKQAGFFDKFKGDPDEGTGWKGYWANKQPSTVLKPQELSYGDLSVVNRVPGAKGPLMMGLGKLIQNSPMIPGSKPRQEAWQEVQKQRLKDQYKSQLEPDADDLTGQFDALQQESMLTDLMANDDILNQRNPHEILQAYSSLRQIAPRAAANRETLRALLRDRLERGGGDIYNLDALTKVEKNLRDIEGGGRKQQEDNQ